MDNSLRVSQCDKRCVAKILHQLSLRNQTSLLGMAKCIVQTFHAEYMCSSQNKPEATWIMSPRCASESRRLAEEHQVFPAQDFTPQQQKVLENAGVPLKY